MTWILQAIPGTTLIFNYNFANTAQSQVLTYYLISDSELPTEQGALGLASFKFEGNEKLLFYE